MIPLAEIKIELARLYNLIRGYLYFANRVSDIGFDFAESIAALRW